MPVSQPVPAVSSSSEVPIYSLPEVPLVVPSTPGHDEVVNGNGLETLDNSAISLTTSVAVSMVPTSPPSLSMPGVLSPSLGYALPVQTQSGTSVEAITSNIATVSIQSMPSVTVPFTTSDTATPSINFLSSSPPTVKLGDPAMTNQ